MKVESFVRSSPSISEVAVSKLGVGVLLPNVETPTAVWQVKECLSSLELTSSYFIIRRVWVPGQSGIAGNCKIDELARGSTLVLLKSE